MPATVRPDNKARKIAWAILGEPANLASKKTRHQRELDRRLLREETYRVR